MNLPRYTLIATLIAGLVAVMALGACDLPEERAPDPDRELMRQLEERAKSRPPRASLSFGFTHELDDIEPGGPVTFDTKDGARVTLNGAWLVVSALEAHLCEEELSHGGSWLDGASDLLVPTVHAHVPNSATRLGVPFVEDLLGRGGKASIVGEVAPPLASYCELYAVVSPADDDVLNLTGLPTSEAEGKTLVLRGEIQHDGATRDFESVSKARHVVDFPAIDPNTGVAPLELSEPGATQMILLQKTVSPALFEGLESAAFTDSTAASRVLERLEKTFRVKQFKSNP